ncbi:MAG: aldose epimerase family protein [Gemmataceae bacterium]|nr:aldose epimerase family protein [Gemmataceae bacterium]
MSPPLVWPEEEFMRYALPVLVVALGCTLTASAQPRPGTGPAYEQEPFGKLPDTKDKQGKTVPGPVVTRYTLVNKHGLTVKCIEYGAIITEIHVPDKNGRFADVALGCATLNDYRKGHPFFGTNAGRCANRIAQGRFTLDGREYQLATNNGPHHLHGGPQGFDKKYWKGEPSLTVNGPSVKFTYTSPDMEEGYPGRLAVIVAYTLTDDNELVIDFRATTDKPTLCNLAHHSYFNLAGHASGDIKGHELTIAAKNYTPTDTTLIPTGKIAPVAGTPFDFTQAKALGRDLDKTGGEPVGYDLNFVLDKGATAQPAFAAKVVEPKSGRVLEVFTTEPGLQLYTGNFLDGTLKGKGGAVYQQYHGFCLEAQKFPDSINKPEWKDRSNVILRPGETYKQTTIYKFGVAK